jgi:protein-S-isoprenylcysteine O-methyltransferase Ste14
MELPVKHAFAVLLWILWCTLHSTLIATRVKDYLRKTLGDWFRFYRLFFNAVSLATLIPVLYYSLSIQRTPIFCWEGHLMIVKYLLLATSIILFVAGGRHYSMSRFLGIRQIKTGRANHTLSEYDTFDNSGILSAIRHPWYTASIMVIWARDISLSTLLINIVISTYFVIGTILEERKLLLEFGENYREYQKNVSMFIPYKWLKAKIAGVL